VAASSQRNDQLITGINVTPLVDVVLVLLVIMMVTAGYIVSRTIPVDLPEGRTGETTRSVLAISLDRSGRTWLDGAVIDEPSLRERIREAHAREREARAVIAADGALPHRDVVRLIDLLREEGVVRFAINVDPVDAKHAP
jgi:biopolymer transport protein ExbD